MLLLMSLSLLLCLVPFSYFPVECGVSGSDILTIFWLWCSEILNIVKNESTHFTIHSNFY